LNWIQINLDSKADFGIRLQLFLLTGPAPLH